MRLDWNWLEARLHDPCLMPHATRVVFSMTCLLTPQPAGPGLELDWNQSGVMCKRSVRAEATVDLPRGIVDLPRGIVNLPQGIVNLPRGIVDLPQGIVDLPQGIVDPDQGRFELQRAASRF